MTVSGTARTLDDFTTCGGVTAVFNAGDTGLGHHWRLFGRDGSPLAHTKRYHHGGKVAQVWWKFVSLTGLDANNDIHVELIGADGLVLARASSSYIQEAVTVTDPAGNQIVRTQRTKEVVSVYTTGDGPVAKFPCAGEDPWPVRSPAGDVLGEVLAGEPGPAQSAPLWQWVIDPRWALNSSAYTNAMHLGLKRVSQYSFVPTGRVDAGLALLPLLCGLSY